MMKSVEYSSLLLTVIVSDVNQDDRVDYLQSVTVTLVKTVSVNLEVEDESLSELWLAVCCSQPSP